ncbi:hypothetical protein PRIPAC_76620, partial [Pristionchus pacificus]|uniref:G protein-coupled receptor n=1 Tax=Pristionchus pacificus TaxID=54126 RepID=A0A2A6C602_PRIPA
QQDNLIILIRVIYRSFPANKELVKQERARLFYTIVINVAHLLKSAQQIFWFIVMKLNDDKLFDLSIRMYRYANALTTWGPPVLLLIMPRMVRREIISCLLILVLVALFCTSVSKIGSMHRNFRCQLCLAGCVYCLGIMARFVLIFYQLFDIPLTDDDLLLFSAEMMRCIVISYYCAIPAAIEVQILVATFFWKWYESNHPSTSLVLIATELMNISISAFNSFLWLAGDFYFYYHENTTIHCKIAAQSISYTLFYYNALFMKAEMWLSVLGFVYTYRKSAQQFDLLSRGKISFTSYTIGRSFQVRENVLLMKYCVRVMVPSAALTIPCFIAFAFIEYGPTEWVLSRSLASAFFDLQFSIVKIVFVILEIRSHQLVRREFNKLFIVRHIRLHRGVSIASSTPNGYCEQSDGRAYFEQLRSAWNA